MIASRDREIVNIEALAAGGDGVGHLRGKVCFVPLTVPGDVVSVRISRENKNLFRAEIADILESSPARREPPCPLFGRCGGCQWLHVDENAQLGAKRQILYRALRTLGKEVIESGSGDSFPREGETDFVPSPRQLGYRRLARLHFDSDNNTLGFSRAGQRTLIDVTTCPILNPELNRCLELLREDLLSKVAGQADVRLASGIGGAVCLVESPGPLPSEFYSSAASMVAKKLLTGVVASVDGVVSTIAGAADVMARGGDGEPLLEPTAGFGQANDGVNLLLGKTVADWIAESGFSNALELFAGAGNLTVAVAHQLEVTSTVEHSAEACRAARKNISNRKLKGVTIHSGDALEVYRELGDKHELVVLDPPRTGHRELARALADGKQRAVLYVSCNPATLSRDLEELVAGGYRLVRARGFDMFPQTAHIEAAVLMER
ncbi:MAG: class I SAM-dependent RNA methyltransferase [Proteobacteria bacterium]|nr:class I SAM-dependent RNA methyltransferase [Pseudomonadota bacterium]